MIMNTGDFTYQQAKLPKLDATPTDQVAEALALVRDYGAKSRIHGVGFEVIRAYKEAERAIVELVREYEREIARLKGDK